MGILTGSLSTRRYNVEGDFKITDIDKISKNFPKFSFNPININVGEIESSGWVNPLKIIDSDVTTDKISFEEYIVLAMRLDKFSFNKKILKARVEEEIEVYCRKKSKTKITRDERKIIITKTQFEMLKTQSPNTQIYEAAWNVNGKYLLFSASSERINNIFCELFYNTIGLTLVPDLPYVKIKNWLKKNKNNFEIEKLNPVEFAEE